MAEQTADRESIPTEPLSMRAVLGFTALRRMWYAQQVIGVQIAYLLPIAVLGIIVLSSMFSAQIGGLLLSGVLAQTLGVRQVFALCTVMLLVLMAAGKLWMEPRPDPPAQPA